MKNHQKNQISIDQIFFGYNKEKNLLKSVSFSLKKGECMVIIGGNGSGKTTLLKLIAGILQPNKGNISLFLNSTDESFFPIFYLTQQSTCNFRFPITVEDFIWLGSMYKEGFPIKENEKKMLLLQLLKDMHMEQFQNRLLSELSSGQMQRIRFIQAIFSASPILLLDEPNSAIDQEYELVMYRILEEEKRKGKTIIMVTHHLDRLKNFSLIDHLFRLQESLSPIQIANLSEYTCCCMNKGDAS